MTTGMCYYNTITIKTRMDRVFSVDEISDQFWSAPPPPPPPLPPPSKPSSGNESSSKMMNRSESEWAFQRYLQEEVQNHNVTASQHSSSSSDAPHCPPQKLSVKKNASSSSPALDSEEYQAFLKTKLDLACAAVALSRVSFDFYCVKFWIFIGVFIG